MGDERRKGAALVTGAAKRIGRAIAVELARRGYAVALHHHRSRDEAEALASAIASEGGRAVALSADLDLDDAPETLVAEAAGALGPLSVLVNSASQFLFDDLASLTAAQWDQTMRVNARAPVFVTRAFAKQLDDGTDDPCVVNLLDQRVARVEPGHFSYGVSKSALHAATAMLAQALAPRVRVNAVAPGPTLRNPYQAEQDFIAERKGTLLGAGSPPEEIVRAVLYLTEARSVTGETIFVDGGQRLR